MELNLKGRVGSGEGMAYGSWLYIRYPTKLVMVSTRDLGALCTSRWFMKELLLSTSVLALKPEHLTLRNLALVAQQHSPLQHPPSFTLVYHNVSAPAASQGIRSIKVHATAHLPNAYGDRFSPQTETRHAHAPELEQNFGNGVCCGSERQALAVYQGFSLPLLRRGSTGTATSAP